VQEKDRYEQPTVSAAEKAEGSSKQKFGGWVNPLESFIENFAEWQFQPSSPQGDEHCPAHLQACQAGLFAGPAHYGVHESANSSPAPSNHARTLTQDCIGATSFLSCGVMSGMSMTLELWGTRTCVDLRVCIG
jgi:hypothetical protein